jgi:hypothetical protein
MIGSPIEQFRKLLDEDTSEQSYQTFLENNSQLLPREFVQNHGIHLNLVLRKLSMAKDYTCDFFYMAKSSGDTNYVLIELEKPSSKLFTSNNNFHSDLLAGLNQVNRWRAWFSNHATLQGFAHGTLKPLQMYGMRDNPIYVKYVLVIGRRAEIEQNSLRRSLITAQERYDFKILSYDSLLEDVGSKRPMYVGVRTNEFIEIESTSFAGESLFSVVPPEMLRIKPALYNDIIAKRREWSEVRDHMPVKYMLDEVLPKVVVAA